MIAWIRRDPPRAIVGLALVLAAALYAPTLGRGLLDYDDAWLIRDNWIAGDLSLSSLRAIFGDATVPIRSVLGAEYLPVRDVFVMIERALFGTAWPAYHAASLALYLAALVVWFRGLVALGLDRTIVAVAILAWAVHPTHAESVAWLAEQKGLLALVFSGACVLAYARYRKAGAGRHLAFAAAAAIAAVWSKAPAAFAIASLGPLELVLAPRGDAPLGAPDRLLPARLRFAGLTVIGAAAAAAFAPVVVVALQTGVVATSEHQPWLATAIGNHGFYVRLAAMIVPNAATYPIGALGPTTLDVVLGGIVLAVALGVVFVRRLRGELRAAAIYWLFGWFPASRLVLPMRHALVADRYLVFATLGVALALATAVCAIRAPRWRFALAATLVLAASARTFVAQLAWHDDSTLWRHAVEAYPASSEAWARYAEAREAAGALVDASVTIEVGLRRAPGPRLLVDRARFIYESDPAGALAMLRAAADAGDAYGMLDLALALDEGGHPGDALSWVRRARDAAGEHVEIALAQCRIARRAGAFDEALAACDRARTMRPWDFAIALDRELAYRGTSSTRSPTQR